MFTDNGYSTGGNQISLYGRKRTGTGWQLDCLGEVIDSQFVAPAIRMAGTNDPRFDRLARRSCCEVPVHPPTPSSRAGVRNLR